MAASRRTLRTGAAAVRSHGRLRRHRCAAAAALSIALAVPAGALALTSQQREARDVHKLASGDIVEVAGAPIGCIVRLHKGELALDCRRAGPLAGTYGTLLTPKQVVVERFESSKVAKVVFQAHHERLDTHVCRR
jgi:hypothetical protein